MTATASPAAPGLHDRHGRCFHYLRLSITEACNYACAYCLPHGYRPSARHEPLTVDEVRRLVTGFARLGITKVRLTGGEPTVRRDLPAVVRAVSGVPGIERVALSTNGDRLDGLASELTRAGLTHVNISLDSLNADNFARITGRQRHARALQAVEAALAADLVVKVNVVVMRGWNAGEIDDFVEWVRDVPITVRFIELMQTSTDRELFARHHMLLTTQRQRLLASAWTPRPRGRADGPADELAHPAYAGGVGFITPYACDFCQRCNRLRVTSTGALRLCLFGARSYALRSWLARDDQSASLQAEIRYALTEKADSHRLLEGDSGPLASLAELGG